MQNYIEYAMSLLLVKYSNNVIIEVEQSANPMMEYFGYDQFDCKERAKA
jgi:hypothetical protein